MAAHRFVGTPLEERVAARLDELAARARTSAGRCPRTSDVADGDPFVRFQQVEVGDGSLKPAMWYARYAAMRAGPGTS
jgi:hypothetical protein